MKILFGVSFGILVGYILPMIAINIDLGTIYDMEHGELVYDYIPSTKTILGRIIFKNYYNASKKERVEILKKIKKISFIPLINLLLFLLPYIIEVKDGIKNTFINNLDK